MSDKIDRVAEDVSNVRVTVAEIATTLKLALNEYNEKIDNQSKRLEALEQSMETALLPIKIGKALAVVTGGLATAVGSIYAVVQFVLGMGGRGGPAS